MKMAEHIRCVPCGTSWNANPPHDFTCPKCKKPGEPAGATSLSGEPHFDNPLTIAAAVEYATPSASQTADPGTVGPHGLGNQCSGIVTAINELVSSPIDSIQLGAFFWVGYQIGRTGSDPEDVVKRLRELLGKAERGEI